MVKSRPDLFSAFVGTGQVAADPTRNYAVAYEEVHFAVFMKSDAFLNALAARVLPLAKGR